MKMNKLNDLYKNIRNIKKIHKLNNFYKNIRTIEKIKNGSNTQITSNIHETSISKLINKTFDTIDLNPLIFKKVMSENGIKIKSRTKHCDDLIIKCNGMVNVTKPNLFKSELKEKQNFLVHQPSGSQDYPDFILGSYIKNDKVCYLTYIECKQLIPSFNNNPPKRNKYCIYICGNHIYNGYLLSTIPMEEKINKYKMELKSLCDKYTDDELKFVPYKKIEYNWDGNGPICFESNKINNIPLLNNCLSRHLHL